MNNKNIQDNRPAVIAFLIRFTYFTIVIAVCFVVYRFFLREIFNNDKFIIPVLGLWLFSAYFFLPRLHRWFSKIYLPNYFIGRVRTYDGLLGDPVNIAVLGNEKQLITALKNSGWTRAEDLSNKSSLKMVKSSIFKLSYPSAPVSSLFLFNRKQNFAFQKEIDGNPHKRHHVRFWATPKKWWLPGGYQADWLGAATYDRRVGFSTLTLQITHKIAENTDEERDFLLKTITDFNPSVKVTIVKHFTSGYHDRNGGGDRIKTDGSLPFVEFK